MGVSALIKSSVHFFVFSSFYIAGCALVMIAQSNGLLNLSYDISHYMWFVFFSTICSYNFHWGLTYAPDTGSPRLSWTRRHRKIHLVLYVAGAVGSIFLFTWFTKHWFWISISILLTFLYSAPKLYIFRLLRRIAIGKTIFLAMVWMYVTTALPVFISGKSWQTTDVLFCLSRFFYIYSICIVFDYRDRDDDKKQGLRSLITYLDARGVDRLFYFSLLVFAAVTITLVFTGVPFLQVCLLLIPGIIMVPLYKIAKKNFSDYLYYIILDGMMMFPALLTLIFK